jgi:hypothetical protein
MKSRLMVMMMMMMKQMLFLAVEMIVKMRAMSMSQSKGMKLRSLHRKTLKKSWMMLIKVTTNSRKTA